MNKNQLKVMWIAIVIGVFMCLYPPFAFRTDSGNMVDRGYRFIADQRGRIQINTPRLFIQLFIVVILATGAIITLKKSGTSKDEQIEISEPDQSLQGQYKTQIKKNYSNRIVPEEICFDRSGLNPAVA